MLLKFRAVQKMFQQLIVAPAKIENGIHRFFKLLKGGRTQPEKVFGKFRNIISAAKKAYKRVAEKLFNQT